MKSSILVGFVLVSSLFVTCHSAYKSKIEADKTRKIVQLFSVVDSTIRCHDTLLIGNEIVLYIDLKLTSKNSFQVDRSFTIDSFLFEVKDSIGNIIPYRLAPVRINYGFDSSCRKSICFQSREYSLDSAINYYNNYSGDDKFYDFHGSPSVMRLVTESQGSIRYITIYQKLSNGNVQKFQYTVL